MNNVHIKLNKKGSMDAVPYQVCPICNGSGEVPCTEPWMVGLTICHICKGKCIIPMHMVDSLISQYVMGD